MGRGGRGARNATAGSEPINRHQLVVRIVRTGDPLQPCHVLFVPGSEKDIPQLLSSVSPGVLTVGEGAEFLAAGGVIAFVIEKWLWTIFHLPSAGGFDSATLSERLK